MAERKKSRDYFHEKAPKELKTGFKKAFSNHAPEYREKALNYLNKVYSPKSSYSREKKKNITKRLFTYAETGSIYETAKSELPKKFRNDPLPKKFKSVKTALGKTGLLLEPATKENLVMAFPKGYRGKAKEHLDYLIENWMGKDSEMIFTREQFLKTLVRRVASDAYKENSERIDSKIDLDTIRKRFHEAFDWLEKEKKLRQKEFPGPRKTQPQRGEKPFHNIYYSANPETLGKLSSRETKESLRYFALKDSFKSRMPELREEFFKNLDKKLKKGTTKGEIRREIEKHLDVSTPRKKRELSGQLDEILNRLMGKTVKGKKRDKVKPVIARSSKPLHNPFRGKEKESRKVYWFGYHPEGIWLGEQRAEELKLSKKKSENLEKKLLNAGRRKVRKEKDLEIAQKALDSAVENLLLEGAHEETLIQRLSDNPKLIREFIDSKKIKEEVETRVLGKIIREDLRRINSKDKNKQPFSREAIKNVINGWVDRYSRDEWEQKVKSSIQKTKKDSLLYKIKFDEELENPEKQIKDYLIKENPSLEYSPERIKRFTDRILSYKSTKSSKEVARMELEQEGKKLTEKNIENRAASIREWLRKRKLTYS